MWTTLWLYVHIPLLTALTAMGAGVLTFVIRGEAMPAPIVRIVMCGSAAVLFVAAGFAEWVVVPTRLVSGRALRIAVLHGLPELLALALAAFGSGLSAIPLLALLVVLAAATDAAGVALRVRLRLG